MNKENKAVLEFFINDMVVGSFDANQYPTQNGEYKYIPYRGPGHIEMQEKLKKDDKAQCKYIIKDKVITFDVTACPKYGVLALVNFREL